MTEGHRVTSGAMDRALDLETRHLFPTYARSALRVASGSGCRLYDDAGRVYLDMLGGIAVNALGHAHPRIVAALRQAVEGPGGVLHCSNLHHHPYQGPLAARLAGLFDLPRVFFCNSGSEAVEAALKLARARARRLRNEAAGGVVAIDGSFHGRTAFALSATGQPKYRAPFGRLVPDVTFVPPDDPEALRRAVGRLTAAVILEPVQGEGGVRPLPLALLEAARAACDDTGALLIADEVQCGLGRTGAWSACRQAGVAPDLVTLAKPLAAGLPLGALLGREDLAQDFGPGSHGSTFGGGPLPCRLALAFLDAVEQDNLIEAVRRRGAQLLEGLVAIAARRGEIEEVRGRGLMLGVVLRRPSAGVAEALLREGVIVGTAGERVLRLLPPFVITAAEVDRFLATLDTVLERLPPGGGAAGDRP
ncbi:MAG TPA: acetylornithine/succinylornithine family transaminase [Candidatus Polarisedimenticolia bacterium]|nr:acetylornithine/succinylornithine family transaminase [Candidatus Polarisedimenticolia bacterium]